MLKSQKVHDAFKCSRKLPYAMLMLLIKAPSQSVSERAALSSTNVVVKM